MSLVYFLRAGDDGPIKIGFTSGPVAKRIGEIQVGCPWPLCLIGTVHGERQHETWLHRRFRAISLSGEWFSPSADLLAAIEQMVAPGFAWPEDLSVQRPAAPAAPQSLSTPAEIIKFAGGPTVLAEAYGGAVSLDAIYKWKKSGIPWRRWEILFQVAPVTPAQMLAANEVARAARRQQRAAS